MTYEFITHSVEKTIEKKSFFDVDAELRKHAWYPNMNTVKADKVLQDKPSYTYLTRPREDARGFTISFVNPKGDVEHHHFTLIEPKYGIWRNFFPHHVGNLTKVICDMMECQPHQCLPF